MAETIGRAYIKILADGTGLSKSVEREMRKADKQAEKSGEDLSEHWADGFDKGVQKQRQDIMKSVDKGFKDVDKRGAVLGKGFGDNFGKELARRIRRQFPELEGVAGDLGERMGEAFLADFAKTGRKDFDFGRRLADALREMREEQDESGLATTRFARRLDDLGDTIGRVFGKGSRNNFLNFFGSLIGNIARLPGLLVEGGVKIAEWGKGIGQAFTDAGGGFRGLVAAAGGIAPALGAATVGLIGFVALVGTATTALLLAAGAAAALVATLSFGLVGAIAPLVGLLGPLGLAASGVAAAFIGMDDAAKKSLKETWKPLGDQLKELGDLARPGIFEGLSKAAENLEEPMKRLRPLFEVIGDSVGKFIDMVSKISFGPGFEAFVDTMTVNLPEMMEHLGVIVGNALDGIAGMFATLQPVTDAFLSALERISGAFADWSISPQAATFFSNAAESASALLDFLGPVWDLTSQILGAGRQAGNDLFREMGDAISGWVDTLRANPDLLTDFFNDAKRMGEAIGNVIVQIGKLIGALDTPLTRSWAIGFINAIGDLIGLIAKLVGWFGDLDQGIQGLTISIGAAMIAFGPLSSAISRFGGAISGFITNVRNGETRMKAFGDMGRAAAGPLGLGLLIDSLTRTDGALGALEGAAGGAMAGFAVGGPWGAAIGAAAGLFTNLWQESQKAKQALEDAADGAADSVGDWEGLADTLNEVTGATTEMTRAFIFEKLTKEGKDGADSMAKSFNELGVSTRTVIDALMGSPSAIAAVESAMSGLDQEIQANEASLQTLNDRIANYNTSRMGGSEKKDELVAQRDALEQTIEQQKNLQQTLDAESEALEESTQAVREKAAAVKDWRHELRGFPEAIITRFENADTLPKGIKDAKDLIRQYRSLQNVKKVRTLFEALGIEKTDKQIKRIIDRAKDAGRQKPKIPVTVKTDDFDQRLNRIKTQIGDLPKKPGKAKADLDTTKFDQKNRDVKSKLDDQNKRTATPKITVDNSQAMTSINNVATGLNNLHDKYITIHVNTVRTGGNPQTASGGIFAGAQTRIIGEAGPEAVVPLSRPLSQVDPAVRELSAIAQGMRLTARRQQAVAQRVIDVGGIQIITPTKDPGAVAQEMVNRLVAVGY